MKQWSWLRLYEAKHIELFDNRMSLMVPNQHLARAYYACNENPHVSLLFCYLYINLVIHCWISSSCGNAYYDFLALENLLLYPLELEDLLLYPAEPRPRQGWPTGLPGIKIRQDLKNQTRHVGA